MLRERAFKVVLVLVGLLFVATIYPLVIMKRDETLQMMLSLYVTLGIFLLFAVSNPSAHRSLIASAAWSSLAHGSVMALQSLHDVAERTHLLGAALAFGIVGVALIALAPTKATVARASE